MTARNLARQPLHLGLRASAVPQPEFPADNEQAMAWYADYAARTEADGAEGRLVSSYRFTEDWQGWEMHPAGDEVVICTGGEMELVQLVDGEEKRTVLRAGEYAVNPAGCWHTADIAGEATAIFITAGQGTQHRPR